MTNTAFKTKVVEVENKMPYVSCLFKKVDDNAKISDAEGNTLLLLIIISYGWNTWYEIKTIKFVNKQWS